MWTGFDKTKPSVWLTEGLLAYLSEEEAGMSSETMTVVPLLEQVLVWMIHVVTHRRVADILATEYLLDRLPPPLSLSALILCMAQPAF